MKTTTLEKAVVRKAMREAISGGWTDFERRIITMGITAEDVRTLAQDVKPETYRKVYDFYNKTMKKFGLKSTFIEKASKEPKLDEEWKYFIKELSRMETFKKSGDKLMIANQQAKCNQMAIDYALLQASYDGLSFHVPELFDVPFQITKVEGCNAFRYSIGTRRYVLPSERKRLLDALAQS